ncbi:MAG: hypothetical protein IJ228_09235 [Succinivibrio sp.]|nr:hypothetical protein [Succinivibrio sp.]
MLSLKQEQALRALLGADPTRKRRLAPVLRPLLEEAGLESEAHSVLPAPAFKQALYDYVKHEYGVDLHEEALSGSADRLQRAKSHPDEKRGVRPVFSELLTMAGRAPVPLGGAQSALIAEGTVLSTTKERLDLSRIRRVIVVENGILFTAWQELSGCLPAPWQNSLLIFRGYGGNVSVVRELLAALPPECEVALYFDCDPAGLCMMLEYCSLHKAMLLLPLRSELGFEVLAKNKKEAFSAQYPQFKSLLLRRDLSPALLQFLEYMHSEGLALTQENLLAHKVRLGLYQPFA